MTAKQRLRSVIGGLTTVTLAVGALALLPAAHANTTDLAIQDVGQSLLTHLRHIEEVGFGLTPEASTQTASTPGSPLSGSARDTLEKAESQARDLQLQRVDDGLVVLSSNIELSGYEVVDKNDTHTTVAFDYLFTRELPELTGEDAWQEVIEYETLLENQSGTVERIKIKDLDYYESTLSAEVVPTEDFSSETGPSSQIGTFTDEESSDVEPFGLSAANRQKVAKYALTWWNSKNNKYPTNYKNDCTNFISQALHVGGWKFKLGLWNSNSAWWGYNRLIPPRASYPWGGAENFYRFAVNNEKRTTIHKYVSDTRVGDILQYKSKGATNMTHSMVVTKKIKGQPYLTYHTSNTKNKPFSEINKAGRTWFAHKV